MEALVAVYGNVFVEWNRKGRNGKVQKGKHKKERYGKGRSGKERIEIK